MSPAARRLRSGELLEVDLVPVADGPHLASGSSTGGGPGPGDDAVPGVPYRASPNSPPPARVVFADDHLVVVDKPAGLVVHPGAGNAGGTLVQQLTALFLTW